MAAQRADENCTPLSDVSGAGTPNQETHPETKAAAHSSVAIPASGIASAQRVERSTTVNKYAWPLLERGRGPTRSK
jgi:hypothetical protein